MPKRRLAATSDPASAAKARMLATRSFEPVRNVRRVLMMGTATVVLLFIAVGIIVWEAIGRLRQPAEVQPRVIIVVAAIGVIINTLTALLFVAGRKHDLNVRGAYLHMASDALVSAAVVVAGIDDLY